MSGHLPPTGWVYRGISAERQDSLSEETNLESLIEEIQSNVVISFLELREPCSESKELKGQESYRVCLELRSTRCQKHDRALDQLLNGAFGLRARYAIDPHQGSLATTRVCRSVAECISANRIPVSADYSHLAESLGEHCENSLYLPSAKAWFGRSEDRSGASSENGEVECQLWSQCRSEDIQEIQRRLSSGDYCLTRHQIESKLLKGRTIPKPSSLSIKGAFVSDSGEEYITLDKQSRSLQIHLLGWS